MFKIITDEQTPKTLEILDIKSFVEEKRDLILSFLECAKKKSNAVGLAANQLEIDGERMVERMFCSKAKKNGDGEWDVFINPKIKEKYGEPQERVEGCLTWPGKRIVADRYLRIDVEWYNKDGEKKSAELNGWEAQVWQHEQDHLDGVQEKLVPADYMTIRSEKIGRNEPCPCGNSINGKPVKYKKCCGKK